MNTINNLFDVIDNPLMSYGFIVICSDSVAFGFVKNLKVDFCDLMLLKVTWKRYFILHLCWLIRMH